MLIVRTGSGYLEPSLSLCCCRLRLLGDFPRLHWTFLLLSPLFTGIAFIVQLLHVTNFCLLFPAVFFFFHFVCCVWSLYAPVFFPSLSPQTPAGRDRWLPLPEPRSARGFFLFKRMFIHIDDCCRLSTQILFEIELNQTEFIFLSLLSV